MFSAKNWSSQYARAQSYIVWIALFLVVGVGGLGQGSWFFNTAFTAYADPAPPDLHTLQQPDGTKFLARLWGDEWVHGWETEDGYPIIQDLDTKIWFYAVAGPGDLVKTTAVVGRDGPPVGSLGARPSAAFMSSMRPGELGAAPPVVTGDQRVLFILIDFTDANHTYSKEDFEDKFADTAEDTCRNNNCTGPGGFRAFYYEMSYGKMNLIGSVSGWHKAGGSLEPGDNVPPTRQIGTRTYNRGERGYYGCGSSGSSCGVGYYYAALLVKEAVLAAHAAGISFEGLDYDGDKEADGVMVFFQGLGEGDAESIWAHRWCITCTLPTIPPPTGDWGTWSLQAPVFDGMRINKYAIQPEEIRTGLFRLFRTMTSIGTPAHEFGHLLGLDDQYDKTYTTEGIGEHGLMGSCNYLQTGGVTGDTPCHMGPWDKWKLGWLQPRRVVADDNSLLAIRSYEIPDYATNDFALLLGENPNGPECGTGANGRYFLVVNRQGTGFDKGITEKVGIAGLQIWRVEEDRGCDNDEYPYGFLTIMEADNNNSLSRRSSRKRLESSDFWRQGVNTTFNDTSRPNSRLVDGTVTRTCVNNIGPSANPMRAGFSEGKSTGTDDIGCPKAQARKVLFYEGHAPSANWGLPPNSIDNPPQALLDLYKRFGKELYATQGYEIHQRSTSPLTTAMLNDCLGSPCGIVVVAVPTIPFSEAEVSAVRSYVSSNGRVAAFGDSNIFDTLDPDDDKTIDYLDHNNKAMIESTVNWLESARGGGLLIIGEWGLFAKFAGIFGPSNQLANAFGLTIDDNIVLDDTFNDGFNFWPEIGPPNTAVVPIGDYVTYASATVSGGAPLARANESGTIIVFSASEYNEHDFDSTKMSMIRPAFEQNRSLGRSGVIPQARVNPSGPVVAAFVDVATAADLALTKTDSPDPVTVGSNITYTLTITNNGPNQATGVTVTDTLPGGVTFVSARSSQGNCSGTNTVTCNLGSLANRARATVTIVVTPTTDGNISNTATVTGSSMDLNLTNNSATADTRVTPPQPCGGVTASSSPTSVTYRPTPTRSSRKTIRVTVTNNSGALRTVNSIVPQPGEPFTIVSISPTLPQVIPNRRSQTFSILTERGAGQGQATARRPYFNTTMDCGELTTATEPRLLVPLKVDGTRTELKNNQLRVEIKGEGIALVRLQLFDLSGRSLVDQSSEDGTLTLPALTDRGQPLANGVYLYVVRVRGFDGREYVSAAWCGLP